MPESFADLGWAWLPAALGAGLVVIFVRYLMMVLRRRRTWTLAEATVGKVRVRESSASGSEGGILVNYHFTDATGQKHMGVQDRTLGKPKRNSTLWVRYDPEDPGMNEAVMPQWAELAIAFGGIAVGAALAVFSLSGGFTS